MKHNVSASTLSYGHAPVSTTWQQYDALTWGVPGKENLARGTYNLPGIVIVDGNFLTMSIQQSMGLSTKARGADLLISSVAEECDLCPTLDFSRNGSNLDPLKAYLRENLGSFGETLVDSHFAGFPAQQAYLDICSDIVSVDLHYFPLPSANLSSPQLRVEIRVVCVATSS